MSRKSPRLLNRFARTGASREEFEAADGRELRYHDGEPPKMHAVHSSSALAVNVFDYWRQIRDVSGNGQALRSIASACGVPCTGIDNLHFEQKRPVCDEPRRKGFQRGIQATPVR